MTRAFRHLASPRTWRPARALWFVPFLLLLLVASVVPAPALAASPEAPEVTVESPVGANEANLQGVLNPKKAGAPGEYQFLYNQTAATKGCKGGSALPVPPGEALGAEHEEPSQTLTGLTAGTEYAVCLREEDLLGGEANISPVVLFTTAAATAPIVEAQSSSAETKSTAVVSATIDPGGDATTCEVKYGKTEALEATPMPCPTTLAAGTTGQPESVELSGLAPNTEYYFRFVANNEKGTTEATPSTTFTTHTVIGATTEPASVVKRGSATLNGTVSPEGAETMYFYEYGTSPCDAIANTCGTRTPTRGPLSGVSAEPAEALRVSRLRPGTTYHYWLVATNAEGTVHVHGQEATFETEALVPNEYVFEQSLAGYTFSTPLGVAVNQTTGDVYATDEGPSPGVIEQYNASGLLQSSIELPAGSGGQTQEIAVDNSCYYLKLSEPECQVQDPSNGAVYVADLSDSLVYKFDRAGAADPADEGSLVSDKTTPTIGGSAVKEPLGVAVDSSGNVYIASGGTGTISKFSATGTAINGNLITGLSSPRALAVDAAGNIYVATAAGSAAAGTFEYTAAGVCVEPETGIVPEKCKTVNGSEDGDRGVTVGPEGNVFIADKTTGTIHEYAPTPGHPPILNRQLEQEGSLEIPSALAVNGVSHTLDLAESGGSKSVKVFRFVVGAVVKTELVSQISGGVEQLNGTVDPHGSEATEYYFEYGLSPCDVAADTCGTEAVEQSAVPLTGEAAIPVSARLDSLAPNTTYHYWVVAFNEETGVEHGEEQTFTTGPVPPPPAAPAAEGSAPETQRSLGITPYPLLSGLLPTPPKKSTVQRKTSKGHAKACKKGFARKNGKCVRKPRKRTKRK